MKDGFMEAEEEEVERQVVELMNGGYGYHFFHFFFLFTQLFKNEVLFKPVHALGHVKKINKCHDLNWPELVFVENFRPCRSSCINCRF